eukprot:10182148-Alexandrium_andersonii.AAC.1
MLKVGLAHFEQKAGSSSGSLRRRSTSDWSMKASALQGRPPSAPSLASVASAATLGEDSASDDELTSADCSA